MLQWAYSLNWWEVQLFFGAPYVVQKPSMSHVRTFTFTRIQRKTKKVTAFDSSGTKAVWTVWAGTTLKRCELPVFFPAVGRAVRRGKSSRFWSLNMQFQQDWKKIKDYNYFKFWPVNLEKFRSTERCSCTSRGTDNFSLAHIHEP